MCCTLVPRIPPHIRFPVRSARVFASGFLSAPLTGIQLPSATLRCHLTGTGLARLITSNFPIGLTPCRKLVRSRERHPQAAGLARHTTTASCLASLRSADTRRAFCTEMIDHEQMRDLWRFLGVSGAGGVLWLIAHGVSALVTRRKRAVRFVVMTLFACVWVQFLWAATGRTHREGWPYVFSILAWWTAIVVGNLIEKKREDSAEPRPPGYRR